MYIWLWSMITLCIIYTIQPRRTVHLALIYDKGNAHFAVINDKCSVHLAVINAIVMYIGLI